MSFKLTKKPSSKRNRSPKENAQAEILHKLGLEAHSTKKLDSASLLNISTWILKNKQPRDLKDLPNAFLRRLWLLSEDARSTCCQTQLDPFYCDDKVPEEKLSNSENKTPNEINPLDLVTSVFICADTFLQQEITVRMIQCKFAVPLVLPNADSEKPSQFLLWPLRCAVYQWSSYTLDPNDKVLHGFLASTPMPIISCLKLGRCIISKSKVLNHVLNGPKSSNNTFIHKGMDGGGIPIRLSNGLVEIGWYLPNGDSNSDMYLAPFAITNLRGDASNHERCLKLLCQASSAVVIFCGDLKDKEKQLLVSCKGMTSKLILIDVHGTETEVNSSMPYGGQTIGSVLPRSNLNEEEVAKNLCEILKSQLPDSLKPVTLESAAELALGMGLNMDESPFCKKAMTNVKEVLKGLDEGSVEFQQKQLPLQGHLWSKLAELDKEESKNNKSENEIEPQLQKEKKDILAELKGYKITPAMKIFIDALLTKNRIERTYFLTLLKLRLHVIQTEKQKSLQESQPGKMQHPENRENDTGNSIDDESFCIDSMSENETEKQQLNSENFDFFQGSETTQEEILNHTENNTKHLEFTTDYLYSTKQQLYLTEPLEDPTAFHSKSPELKTYTVGVEHFLRELGLIFEFTHKSRGQNVVHLPKLAAELLLNGVQLELMDGDASNIPMCWLDCVFAELNRSLRQDKLKIRVLTILGDHHARNAEVLSGLFGVKLQGGWNRTNKGVYMVVLSLPDDLRKDFESDILLLINVEGLGLVSGASRKDTLIQDNMMATVAAGLSDVVLQNISCHSGEGFDTTFATMVNALIRTKECGAFPQTQLLIQDEGIDGILQASQLRHVCKILQTKDKENVHKHQAINTSTIIVKGPWPHMSLLEKVDKQYTKDVLQLKQNLFGALQRSANTSESSELDFLGRVSNVWCAVKSDSFDISLQNTNIALVFSLLCTKFSQWEDCLLENMESWLMGATTKILATNALDAAGQNIRLIELRKEAQEEVISDVNKLKSKAESYLMAEEILKLNSKTFWPILMSNMSNLQERVSKEIMQKLETIIESQCSFTQIKIFETSLQKEQEFKLLALVETSKSTNILLQDQELEEEFELVWKKILSTFDFRPSERDDISSSMTNVLRQNLVSRRHQKHIDKLNVLGQNQNSSFQVCDEHFGYRSRLKHMFEDNTKQQKLEAQNIACKIIEKYNQFCANKCSLAADFSESYIIELLEMIENGLQEKSLEIRSAFEVDLKIYLCNAACQDFQKLHDRFAKDKELLTYLSERKDRYAAEFIYQFRKRDQSQRVAQAFINMIMKPLVLEYINQPLGMQIATEIKDKTQQYQSPHAFHQSILEDLINEDCFESVVEYLLFYEDFRLRKILETVTNHLFDTSKLGKLKQKRLGEIVGKIATAVSQTTEGTSGVLSDTKPLLENVCLILEREVNIDVKKEFLNGPLFSITAEWDFFVKCLMELVATMQLGLGQEFNQNVNVHKVLADLPVQPQEHLLQIVRGCDKRCPLCKAPCDEEQLDHDVHSSLLHRPKGIQPHYFCSPTHYSCPDTMEDSYGESIICKNLHLEDPNWSNASNDLNIQKAKKYWRYILVSFNEKFAAAFNQELAKFPEDWMKITKEEAKDSLKEVFTKKE